MKKISLLGASGSIGRQTLDVCSWEKEQLHNEIEICAMTANQDWRFLADAARRFHPAVVAIGDAALAGELKDAPVSYTHLVVSLVAKEAWIVLLPTIWA